MSFGESLSAIIGAFGLIIDRLGEEAFLFRRRIYLLERKFAWLIS
jgi:hypothetical protein